ARRLSALHCPDGRGSNWMFGANHLLERSSSDMRHDDCKPRGAKVEDRPNGNDVWVIDLRDVACLAREPRERLVVVDVFRANELDLHLVAGGSLSRQVHERRSPATDLANDLVVAVQRGVRGWDAL